MDDFALAGLHRGIVEDNADPLKIGRLKVRVAAAYGNQPVKDIPWAWPCLAYGGMPQMALYAVPEKGAGIWVEFQWKNGKPDPTHPVWKGVWIAEGETPEEVEGSPEDAHHYKVFKTTCGHSITFCDKPGEEYIFIKHGTAKQFILLDKDGNIVDRSRKGGKVRLNPNI